jgi:hypothetical protein
MSRFKEALERGKKARRQQVEHARNEKTGRDAPVADFDAQARAWLNDVVVASLEAAKADVAGEVTVDIDPAPHRRVKASIPSIDERFRNFIAELIEDAAKGT